MTARKIYRTRYMWREDQEQLLISVWAQKYKQLRTTKKNSRVYVEMAKLMNDDGVPVTALEVKLKIGNLTTKYSFVKNFY